MLIGVTLLITWILPETQNNVNRWLWRAIGKSACRTWEAFRSFETSFSCILGPKEVWKWWRKIIEQHLNSNDVWKVQTLQKSFVTVQQNATVIHLFATAFCAMTNEIEFQTLNLPEIRDSPKFLDFLHPPLSVVTEETQKVSELQKYRIMTTTKMIEKTVMNEKNSNMVRGSELSKS